jgi:hypothetical protein
MSSAAWSLLARLGRDRRPHHFPPRQLLVGVSLLGGAPPVLLVASLPPLPPCAYQVGNSPSREKGK